MAKSALLSAKKPEVKKENPASRSQQTGFSQSSNTSADRILFLQRTIGNQAVGKLIKSGALEAKLSIGAPGDIYEQEADRVAEQVMRMPEPQVSNETKVPENTAGNPIRCKCQDCKPEKEDEKEPIRTKEISGSIPEVAPELESGINAIRGGGQPLPGSIRSFYEPRFGQDFSGVRVHTDSKAARAVNAKAFTVGQDVVFGAGQYDTVSKNGKYLLAHELVHTMQQGKGIGRRIQLTRLGIYSDASQSQNDPAKISDTDLRATDEFTWLDSMYGSGWRAPLKSFTESEILLALRLIIRHMHTQSVTLSQDQATFQSFAIPYLERAQRQSGAAGQAEALAGQLTWTALGPPDFSNPATARSAFTRWLLVPNAPEPTDTSTMNCWELALYSAYRGGFTTKTHLQAIYTSAAAQTGMGVPREIERLVCGSRFTFDLSNPQSREPIRGDIVIFNEFAGHVAISLGTKTASGQHEVMSLWSVPSQSGNRVFRTTIETLAGTMGLTSVSFCTPNW